MLADSPPKLGEYQAYPEPRPCTFYLNLASGWVLDAIAMGERSASCGRLIRLETEFKGQFLECDSPERYVTFRDLVCKQKPLFGKGSRLHTKKSSKRTKEANHRTEEVGDGAWEDVVWVPINGKNYGPYRRVRWRDQSGKIRCKYLGKAPTEPQQHSPLDPGSRQSSG